MRHREQILTTAQQVFGNPERAQAWLIKQAIGLSQRLQFMLLNTDQGYMEVADFLVRLDYGVN
ncbi:MbcA/ParS/Xre antitoxin family protein [Pseudomonas kermanshahensis]|uniref:MbcA/ParS/Xre antitoxin family protein n=1 Tax=Pseudomonas kermanshahensis TaxID=2745482 RepID=A0ABU8R6W1_9PSED